MTAVELWVHTENGDRRAAARDHVGGEERAVLYLGPKHAPVLKLAGSYPDVRRLLLDWLAFLDFSDGDIVDAPARPARTQLRVEEFQREREGGDYANVETGDRL